jgi:hypothetical protein
MPTSQASLAACRPPPTYAARLAPRISSKLVDVAQIRDSSVSLTLGATARHRSRHQRRLSLVMPALRTFTLHANALLSISDNLIGLQRPLGWAAPPQATASGNFVWDSKQAPPRAWSACSRTFESPFTLLVDLMQAVSAGRPVSLHAGTPSQPRVQRGGHFTQQNARANEK